MWTLCFYNPPNQIYTPYFEEFQNKWTATFTAVDDLLFCEAYAAVSKSQSVGDQTKQISVGYDIYHVCDSVSF